MKTTQRKCQACNCIKDRDEMIKITRLKDGIKINPSSKELGRSMYVCKDLQCVKKLIKNKRIKTALKVNDYEMIKQVEDELLKIFI